MQRLFILPTVLLVLAGCTAKTDSAVTSNTGLPETNVSEDLIETNSSMLDGPVGWNFEDKTDPISDDHYYHGLIKVSGSNHNIDAEIKCSISTGIPSLTVDTYNTGGEAAPIAYDQPFIYRGDQSEAYSLTLNNTRFNNSRVIIPSETESASWLPLLGKTLNIKVSFRDGDDNFTLNFDDNNFRAIMTPCVQHWKKLKSDQEALIRKQALIDQAQQEIQSPRADSAQTPDQNSQPSPF